MERSDGPMGCPMGNCSGLILIKRASPHVSGCYIAVENHLDVRGMLAKYNLLSGAPSDRRLQRSARGLETRPPASPRAPADIIHPPTRLSAFREVVR
jgi:hypothetical protein